ncbi:hypothetical protein MNV49_003379 [Pseudohyphozyma bogoriensis]|nr:hypothetical protein MNV49_003379 [Pseudohyphozyma bogoriensis]
MAFATRDAAFAYFRSLGLPAHGLSFLGDADNSDVDVDSLPAEYEAEADKWHGENTGCKCKTGCKTARCACYGKHGAACSSTCGCSASSACRNPLQNLEYVFGPGGVPKGRVSLCFVGKVKKENKKEGGFRQWWEAHGEEVWWACLRREDYEWNDEEDKAVAER